MKPNKPANTDSYSTEDINCDDYVTGVIEDIERDENHSTTFDGETKVKDCIRFAFKLDGYTDLHHSRWITFTYGEKGNLYKKYLSKLVDGAIPDCYDFDIEDLKGMKVKIQWACTTSKKGYKFYNVETIRPADGKVTMSGSDAINADEW